MQAGTLGMLVERAALHPPGPPPDTPSRSPWQHAVRGPPCGLWPHLQVPDVVPTLCDSLAVMLAVMDTHVHKCAGGSWLLQV